MLEINESFNIDDIKYKKKETNKENIDNKSIQFTYFECFKKINLLIYNELYNNTKNISSYLYYTDIIINIYLNEINDNNNTNKNNLSNKILLRNIMYMIKLLKNKKYNKLKTKINNNILNENISQIFIIFNYNILKHVLITKKNNDENKKYKIILKLNKLLNIILNIIGISYINTLINDDYFESIIKFILILSISNSIEKRPKQKDEIIHMMFFKSVINLIKLVFKKLYVIRNEYTQRQEELINNIIIFINEKILGSFNKENNDIKYTNKVFLSKNDYKASSLLSLVYIISKVKSENIRNNFTNLLTDIFAFSFKYENGMKPTLQLLEPLFLNINKKNINEIKNELFISDFSLSFIKSLIIKEYEIYKRNICMLRQGFYFGNEISGLTLGLNSLENEFIIMFGFKLESNKLNYITLFDILNNKSYSSQIKFYLSKTTNNDSYELFFYSESKGDNSTRINIYAKKTYIFVFHFKMKGMMKNISIKIKYIKTDENNNDPYNSHSFSGRELIIKNFKNDNLSLYFGCKLNKMKGEIENEFIGFFGDIIILNTKNIKEKNEKNLEIDDYLLNLQGNYCKFLDILEEKNENRIFEYNNTTNNPKFIQLKEKILEYNENDFKLLNNIKEIISSKYFRIIEYHDEIDYMDNNFNYYKEKKNKIFELKKKYIDIKEKSDYLEDDKKIKINTSLFNKNFHIFENEFTLIEFMRYDGIYYLCLLFEYYYQTLNHLIEIKDNNNINQIKEICKEININILNILYFFDNYIIQKKLYIKNWKEIYQFFYQMTITLGKFIEIDILNIETIQYLSNMITKLDEIINENIKKKEIPKKALLIRKNLIDFLLNSKLYRKKDENSIEKLNFVFINLLIIIKYNIENNIEIEFLDNIFELEIFQKLMSFLWIFDNKSDINIIKKEETNKNLIILEKLRENYSILLIEFLKSFSKKETFIKFNSETSVIKIEKEKNNLNISRSSKDLSKDNLLFLVQNIEEEKNMINLFLDRTIENRKNQYIFFNMTNIIIKTNLIKELGDKEIGKIIKELKEKSDKKDDNKKIVYLSCIRILIEYYFFEYKDNNKLNKRKNIKKVDKDLHILIRNLDINLDLFYSLISSFKYLNNFINKPNSENTNIKVTNEKEDLYSFSTLPLNEININNLNEIQSYIIKTILEDIIYLLYKNEIKNYENLSKKKDEKSNDSFNSSKSDQNIGKEIYDILKKNIDIIFKFPESELYKKIFSSENEICAELFYLKWKIKGDEEQNYIEKVIKRYHSDLLINHCCPFIFKFLYFLSNEKNLPFGIINEENDIKIKKKNNLKINIMTFIIEILNKNKKKITKEKVLFYINNLMNFLVLLNQELNINQNLLFKNSVFCKAFYNFIILLEESGIFYTNYYIESNENFGKIVSEIIYDIFFAMDDTTFEENKFLRTFIKYINKTQRFTAFYLIDLCKENILEKEKRVKEELEKYIPEIVKLRAFHKQYLSVKKKKLKIFLKKKLYPIEDVNFSLYFLAKSFIYLNSNIMKNNKNKFKKILIRDFLPLLSENIVRLFTQREYFYGKKTCQNFPLYNFTKIYFESYLVQNPNRFENYQKFFQTDMKVNLKEEYNINFCYSSRLLNNSRMVLIPNRLNSFQSTDLNDSFLLNKSYYSIINNNSDLNNDIKDDDILNSAKTLPYSLNKKGNINLKDLLLNNKNIKEGNQEEFDSSNSFENIKPAENEEKVLNNLFEIITQNNLILNPRNFFFKGVFSEIFKNIIFNDNIFKLIRQVYLIKYRKYKNIYKESKQINFPTKQKNFSNYLEPRMFLQRDFNFYDNNFFAISHRYIKRDILDKNLKNNFLYPHRIGFKKDENNKYLFCEMVSRQYIYFGKIYFLENYIIFESEEDPRNNENNKYDLQIFLNFGISNRSNDNITSKKKIIIIFYDDIKEITRRRTLLVEQSLEIFIRNGKTYFFNFFRVSEFEKALLYLNEINKNFSIVIFDNKKNKKDLDNVVSMFKNSEITNYEYLLFLNKYSTRTYNDLSQYPVFPWLVLNHDNIPNIFSSIENKTYNFSYLRDMNFPISMQKISKRNESIEKFKDEQSNFPFHLHNHYSTSAFIYYYLMRMNPYGQNMIKLQNFKIEDPDRIFNSYKELEVILKEVNDNRELIPDMFCYFDYFCNLNCAFMGFKKNGELNDDFKISNQLLSKYTNNISRYVNYLYTDKKLLNSTIVSKVINRWVDIIFGKNQLPENFEEAAESCNIYNKLCYEQKVNFEQKFAKYQELIKRGKISPKIFINKMKNKIDLAVNFGMTPRKIFNNNSVQNEEKNKTKLSMNNVYNSGEDKLIYFKKLPEDSYLFLKDYDNKKNKSRIAVIFDNNNFKSKKYNIYYCKSLNLFKINKNFSIKLGEQNIEIPLYNPSYSISYLYLKTDNINKINIPVVLSCRYLGNYFLVQILDKSLRVFCEDIVTCIKGRNLIPKGDENFFTGLLNGKLIEWKIRANFNLREIKHVYSHQSSITAIEIFSKQRIIITAGEDKFIYIRKLYDFELLTVIDLTYSFGNPIVSQTSNVFPILLKISDLNLIYVLLYDYESKNTFIRGYNLNGLFFAQSDEQNFIDNKSNNRLLINNISFTKNSNLVVGFYYSDKYSILEPWGLTPVIKSQIIKNSNKMEFSGIQLVEFDHKIGAFYILYNNEFYINSSIEELKKLESF